MEIWELKAALEDAKAGEIHVDGYDVPVIEVERPDLILEAAQAYADILPMLTELTEAREKATKGEWFEDSHRPDQATIKVNGPLKTVFYKKTPTLCVLQANLIQSNEEKHNTAKFITTAANLITKIGERMRGK